VLRARLADARFYWDVDLKSGLEKLARDLEKIVWLESVGTLAEKSRRVTAIAERLGEVWFPKDWPKLRDDVLRAAHLAKADLASEMIKDGKEFTGLQGVIGARYAEVAGESETFTNTLVEQYLPRGAGDPLPESQGGIVLSFADRLDTVTGCWGAGFVPTGSQDPYALRRAANGMVRILMEKELHANLTDLVGDSVSRLPKQVQREGLQGEVLDFLSDRATFFLRERGISYDVVDAVLCADADDPLDARARAQALQAIREDERLERLVIGFKRAANILKGIDESELPDAHELDWSKTEKAERDLHKAVQKAEKALVSARKKKDYPAMLRHLLELRGPIDTFFDDVLVMTDSAQERDRRLALLAEARELFHHFFDPARIVIEGEQ
jgi:glycyl-tRNA synthetase beta chain